MIEIAFMAALAFVIDLVIPTIEPVPGVYLNFSMIPIFLLAFRRGVIPSAVGGLLWGLLQIVTAEAYFLHIVQVILEYILALLFISVAGFFRTPIQSAFRERNLKKGMGYVVLAVTLGSLSRYFWHFLAGFIFWTRLIYKMETVPGILFALWTQGLSAIGSAVLCSLILVPLLRTAPRLLKLNS